MLHFQVFERLIVSPRWFPDYKYEIMLSRPKGYRFSFLLFHLMILSDVQDKRIPCVQDKIISDVQDKRIKYV